MVKAVEITLEGPEPIITGFGRAEISPSGGVEEAVAQVFAENKFRGKRVCAGVSGQSTVVRYVPMMRMSKTELAQAIQFEVDKYLPFEIDEVAMDCQALGNQAPASHQEEDGNSDRAERMTVLLAACRRELIEERVSLVQDVGLTPVAIDLDLFALANAWELCGVPDDEVVEEEGLRASALIDVGASRTSINVLRDGESCFSREINIGGADMTQAVARRLGVEGFEAEAIKRASEGREAEVNSAISPVLEDLASELGLSIDYVENHDGLQVEELLLSGGGVLAPGAVAYIEQATSRPARTWNPLEGLRVDVNRVDVEELEAWAPSLVVAVGLAAKVRTV